jgi:acyl transferase domain-containing protein/acyl carrier protein
VKSKNKKILLMISNSNPFVKNHFVQGQAILPGLAYIDMLFQIIKKYGFDVHKTVLKNLSIYNPLVAGDDWSVELTISLKEIQADWEILIEGIEKRAAGTDSQNHQKYISAQLHHDEAGSFNQTIDIVKIKKENQMIIDPETGVYAPARQKGLVHQGIMKPEGTIYLTDKDCIANLKVPVNQADDARGYLFHPALIDGGAMAASVATGRILSKQMPEEKNGLFLPIFFESFSASELLNSECYARVPGSTIEFIKEIIHFDIEFFNSEGKQVGILKRLTSKRVRPDNQIYSGAVKKALPGSKYLINETALIDRNRPDSLQHKVLNIFSRYLALPPDQIDPQLGFFDLGLESAHLMEIVKDLEILSHTTLNPVLMFEYNSIQELIAYFEKDLGMSSEFQEPTKFENIASVPARALLSTSKQAMAISKFADTEIAIIGVSGRYPQAGNINEFWKNLRDGKDCITEIPKDRWDHSRYFDEDKNKPGKIYSKWGGFMEGVDQFDPLFFNISPREGEFMDPQERLFLECAYEVLEDAGYTRETLAPRQGSEQGSEIERNVGVYVGVMYEEYQLYGAQEQIQGRPVALSGNPSSIANRVSYFCNFHGPSMAIDTACSSSLTAIHLACQSLKQAGCQLAIAGGVNVSIHPNKYLMLSQGKFVSSKGRCESFGRGGDGYVPGEGVGAILLKPLSKAIADGDRIYGILKGSAINHGGKTSGYTVPNPNAQAEVIGQALQEAGIDPRIMSYVEAHGTGTVLGDPIEIAGLTKAFQKYTKDQQFCAIGSAKSNIGHCESAAGIAGVTKVLLQLKNRQLVPSLHSEELNSNIDFGNTPFIVQKELTEWKRPVVTVESETREYPRIAGISSFGAGGSNAHIVIEEYIPQNQKPAAISITPRHPAIIVLSAKNEERLKEQVERLLTAIREQQLPDHGLADMAYTLQVGREAMEERLAMIVSSLQELQEKLGGFLEGRDGIIDLYRGQVKRNQEAMAVFTADEDLQRAVESWVNKGKYSKLADLWVKGLVFDWEQLYGENKPQRISLPTYPFAKERYWVPVGANGHSPLHNTIHPLLHENTSDLSEQRYSSTFTGQEFFLKDHVVKGRKILPGVASLEMARAAVAKAAGSSEENNVVIRLKNVVWTRPIEVGEEPVQVHIGLYPEDNGEIIYEVYRTPETGEAEVVIYSQGSATLAAVEEIPVLDLTTIQAGCAQKKLSGSELYSAFKTIGLDYGPGHRGIEMLYAGQGLVLAKLSLPAAVADTAAQYVLHPSIMDAAFQASIGMLEAGDIDGVVTPKLALPFALQELDVYNSCTDNMWALIRHSKGSTTADKVKKIDIDLCDEQGHICVRITGCSARVLEGEIEETGTAATTGSVMFEPVWKESAVENTNEEIKKPGYNRQLVVLCEPGKISPESIESGMNGVRVLSLQSKRKGIDKRFQTYVAQVFEEIQNLFNEKLTAQVFIQLVVARQEEQQLFTGLSGLLKTAQLENPKVLGQLIELEQWEDEAGIIAKLKENRVRPLDNRIRYQEGKRLVAGFNEIKVTEAAGIPWKEGGVYLITGGAGGLGIIFAREITEQVKGTTLILTGRSSLSDKKQASIKKLELNGAKVIYRAVDVSDRKAVNELIRSIGEEFGRLDGIIHSAGVIRDSYIIKKNTEEFTAVLSPKVAGLVNLDTASHDLSLDFLIVFSSVAGSLGSPGQADYATANAFMDAYAKYRNTLVDSGQRRGRTLSVNWPLWQEGGMRVDETVEKLMKQNTGMIAMRTETGIRALYQGIASGRDQVLVIEGELRQIRATFLREQATGEEIDSSSSQAKPDSTAVIPQDLLREKTINYLKKLLSPVIKLPVERIEADTPMEEYGINSIMVMDLTNQLEKNFGSLSKTLFFEYQTIRDLSGYFLETYREQLNQLIGIEKKEEVTSSFNTVTASGPVMPVVRSHKRPRFIPSGNLSLKGNNNTNPPLDIAIIGVSGRYPQARNLDEFWKNLRNGKDCITEIPKERWDHSRYFDEDKNKLGKTYSKWGGFLEGVDQFDPLFFNISPREAEIMDPQERLFLECVYETLEDAGYTRETLAPRQGSEQGSETERNIGVYVGVMYEEYQLYGAQAQVQGFPVALPGNPSSIANRVSYFCNFHGPSVTLDTMCSSSLTAIHSACQSIRNGGCELAIAGGVNVSIHPNKYLILAQGKFVSSKGCCESFGKGGDGYVPGEGVGAVLLKPLSKAIADGDQIYGVIKGTAINHGGKTNGYSVPNPNAQAGVIGQALQEAGIDPRTISYIEAHGTGTSLGDPIEITGMVKAFQKYTGNKQFCVIGSAKSNIGHCESAAGIAGITKILLQMKNRQIVPSLHSEELNPNIDFLNTPFIVQQELTEWERPVVTIDGETREYPRIAGISAFGAGGSNAHIVIEEYISGVQGQPALIQVTSRNPVLIVLSAKNEERLKERVQQLLTAVQTRQFKDDNLADLAYTLQIGREAMEERLAMVVSSLQELNEKLEAFLAEQDTVENLYRGQVKRNQETLDMFIADEEMQEAIQKWIQRKKYGKLLALWVKGLVFDFNRLYGENKPRRISLPTYPFARERYWVPEYDLKPGEVKPVISKITKPPKTEKVILIKDWRPKEIKTKPDVVTGTIVVLGTEKITKLALSLFQDTERVKVIPVIHGESGITDGIATDFYSSSAGEALYRRVKEELNGMKLTGVIDLTAYDEEYEQSTALEAGKLIFLQKLVENERQQGYCLMQVTYRLNHLEITKTTMQGARLAGLYRMLGTEYQQIKTLTMDTDCPLNFYKKSAKQIQTEFINREREDYSECCYRNDLRYEPELKTGRTEAEIQADSRIPARYQPEEVVLITGGSRGIGAAIAGHIVSQGVKNLIIMGREELPEQSAWKTIVAKQDNPKLIEKLKRLQSYIEHGVKVRYYNTSLSDETGIRAMAEKTHQELGPITGVFHCAGLVSKTPVFFEKPLSEMEAVCEPKMSGLVTLHRALAEEPLSFFMLFSSISGIAPTLAVGQSDYATANAYMDYYVINQAGQGKTYLKSVQWSAWGETGMAAGGMRTPAYLNTGLVSHSTADGLMLLDVIKQGPYTVSVPCVMIPDKFIPNQLLQTKLPPFKKESGLIAKQGSALKPTGITRELGATIREWLREIFVSKLKLGNDQWDSNKNFDEYGVDSIILAQLVTAMQDRVTQPLDPSLLLQFRTTDELAEYFALHHGEAFGATDQFESETITELDAEAENDLTGDNSYEPVKIATGMEYPEIAIIGIACRFPGSPDKKAYWDLLTGGITAFKPVPEERWESGRNRRDYGGWIDEIDLFDAKFFNINEKDAVAMDPQARVILEESLKAIYDAGYDHKQLSGRKIGVYIGGRLQPNLDMATILQVPNPILGMGQNYMAANISRFFNFTGPSMVVDTACSSGLTGMSLAAEALQGRRIEMALAGAVNLLLNSNAFEMFAARNILSKNGEFHIFEEQSGGEVLGEGAGVVILKRLDDAIRDGNRIYGVIKAIAVNNDGRTIGPGSPNINTQKQVIKEALALSGKIMEEIGYIEVNGGGSPVVDAVEIKSLAETYCLNDQNLGPCFLGSIKPNIGHLLLTSGMAELIRCVLSVYHKQIPPFLSAREPFPYYDFGNSRIRFNRETIDWEVPTGRKRVAALNSFPDGGTNCHVIIEEFVPDLLSYQPLFTPKELPAMNRKALNMEDQIERTGNGLAKQEPSPNYQGQHLRTLESLLSGFKKEPSKSKEVKSEVLMTKWGEIVEHKK